MPLVSSWRPLLRSRETEKQGGQGSFGRDILACSAAPQSDVQRSRLDRRSFILCQPPTCRTDDPDHHCRWPRRDRRDGAAPQGVPTAEEWCVGWSISQRGRRRSRTVPTVGCTIGALATARDAATYRQWNGALTSRQPALPARSARTRHTRQMVCLVWMSRWTCTRPRRVHAPSRRCMASRFPSFGSALAAHGKKQARATSQTALAQRSQGVSERGLTPLVSS